MTIPLMPAFFIGHGSPMNAIESNDITLSWQALAKQLPLPRAILVISAHWYVSDLMITSQETNKTIHDFFGFPEQLAQYDYQSHGSPSVAAEICSILAPEFKVNAVKNIWGLDHGAWSILTHIYPQTTIPILQLSINNSQPLEWHYQLGVKLSNLREHGILIIGSGNIVHNLAQMNWHSPTQGYPWATAFDSEVSNLIKQCDFNKLVNYVSINNEATRAVPTLEHYLPLLYILGLVTKKDSLKIFNQVYQYGSLSMTSVQVGG